MRTFGFSKRCATEILRDPLNFAFGLGFPVVLLLLLSSMQKNLPVDLFAIDSLSPGVTVFGLSFITLFSATLISRDRESAFLQRLYTTPMRALDFILGYMIPLIPIAIAQAVVCYLVAIALGLSVSVNIVYAVLAIIPISVLYVGLGLLCGSVLNVKQVGGVCGALLTNLSAWLSGVWFELSVMGEGFSRAARLLPFYHAVELERALIGGDFSSVLGHIYPIIAYDAFVCALAVLLFLRGMKKN